MAHYAYLDDNNKVVAVIVGKDESEVIDGLDTETYYAQGTPYTVKRTSFNSKIRGTYASIGYSYDADEDIFITPQPYLSWIKSGSFWNPPTKMPSEGKWFWNEPSLAWVELQF